jgi:hypothetical protein
MGNCLTKYKKIERKTFCNSCLRRTEDNPDRLCKEYIVAQLHYKFTICNECYNMKKQIRPLP